MENWIKANIESRLTVTKQLDFPFMIDLNIL